MKTLELKDICGYLPYGVKVYLDGKSYTVTKWQNGSNNNMLAQQDNGTSSLIFNSGRGDAKFILRPMSDLTEEITHRGEKFVPLIELAKIFHPNIPVYEWRNPRHHTINDSRIWRIDEWNDGNHIVVSVTDDVCVPLFCRDLLDRLLFDYRSLISTGLAIDVNTLPENPYER